MSFLTALTLIIIFLASKIFFFGIEPLYAASLLGNLDLLLYVILFILGIISFSRNYIRKDKKQYGLSVDKNTLFILFPLILVIILSIYLNLNKQSLDWDAVALYDARAKFLISGINFTEMASLSAFDNLNKYYYTLYPPFTSLIHYFWYQHISFMPISIIYSIFLILLGFVYYQFLKNRIKYPLPFVGVLILLSNKNIFSLSLIEYTNLPFTLYVTAGILIITEYLRTRENWKLLFGVILVSASQWIRFLEPIWLIITISLLITSVVNKKVKSNLLIILLLTVLGLVQNRSWAYFLGNIVMSPQIFSLSIINIMDGILGIFTGAFISILIYTFVSWGISLLIHICSLININGDYNINSKVESVFFKSIIVASIFYYLFGMYYTSFIFDWWRESSGSLTRSSSFLIPLSIYLLIVNFQSVLSLNKIKENVRKSGFKKIFYNALN